MASVYTHGIPMTFGWARFIGAGSFGVERQRV